MPSPFSDFINQYIGLSQLNLQREQEQRMHGIAQATAAQTIQQLAQSAVDPEKLRPVVEQFRRAGLGTPEALGAILQGTAPTAATLQAYSARQGMLDTQGVPSSNLTEASKASSQEAMNRVLTSQSSAANTISQFFTNKVAPHLPGDPESLETLAQADAAREIGGTGVMQLLIGRRFGQQPVTEQTRATRIATDLELGAGNQLNASIKGAELRQRERQITSESAIQEADLALRKYGFDLQSQQSRLRSGAGLGPEDVPGLLDTETKLQNAITAGKNSLSPAQVAQYMGTLASIQAILRGLGVPSQNEEAILQSNPNTFNAGGISGWLGNMLPWAQNLPQSTVRGALGLPAPTPGPQR